MLLLFILSLLTYFFSCSFVIYWHCTYYSHKGDNFWIKAQEKSRKSEHSIVVVKANLIELSLSLSEKSIVLEERTSSSCRVALSSIVIHTSNTFRSLNDLIPAANHYQPFLPNSSFSPINYDPSFPGESLLSQLCFRLKLNVEQLLVIDHLNVG